MTGMRTLSVTLSILAGLMLVPPEARAGDWRAVENLAAGSRISVKAKFRTLCDFHRATDTVLICQPAQHSILTGPGEISFDRARVREVRLERSDHTNTAVGAAIGAGFGAAVGASARNPSLTPGGSALLLGGAGSIIGGFVGRDFPILHGKVIYKR